MMDAGIRLWVLTGDKQETAIEIGKSCNLINEEEMELIVLSSPSKNDFEKKLSDATKAIGKSTKTKRSIVIDGFTLTFALESEKIAKRFFLFGVLANSVICCRVSPK